MKQAHWISTSPKKASHESHREGDDALKAAADIFRKSFRNSDIIARIGGDEFTILAIDTGDSESTSARLQRNLDVCRLVGVLASRPRMMPASTNY